MGKAVITTQLEIPEASKPEKAWVEGSEVHVNFHEYHKDLGYRVDTKRVFLIEEVSGVLVYLGANRSFKGLVVELGHMDPTKKFLLSNSHKKLAREIVVIMKKNRKLVSVYRVKRKRLDK